MISIKPNIMMSIRSTQCVLLLGTLVLVGCGIKVQTGGEDAQRQEEVADYRGKDIRATWGDKIRLASPVQKVNLFKTLIDSVGESYFRYGNGIADDWRTANQGSDAPLQDSTMRNMVLASNKPQEAILQAYEDVLEHALTEIKATSTFDQQSLGLYDRYARLFYDVRNAVFYPAGTVEAYVTKLDNLRADVQRMSDDIARDLRRY